MDLSIAIPGYGLIEAFFTVGSTILAGFLIGYICVGLFVYDAGEEKDNGEGEKEFDQYEADNIYQNLYYKELENMEDMELDKDSLAELRNLSIREMTSRGEVVMTYNSDTESFWYWTDNKNINYRLLDTVARKFALDYNCKMVCVSYKDELNKAHEKIMLDERERERERRK